MAKTTIGELATIVTANIKPFQNALRVATRSTRTFSERSIASLRRFARSATRMAAGAVASLTRAVVELTTKFAKLGAAAGAAGIGLSIKLAADMESLQTTFTVLLKSADEAKRILQQIEQFAASTPFQFGDLAAATKQLVAFGFAGNDAVKFLKNLGEISAATDAPIGELAEIFGKMRVQGRLFGEDLNQILGRGINILPLLAERFGVAEDQVKKLVSEGKVGFKDVRWAIERMTEAGGQFAGVMQARSQTVNGLLSTLRDNFVAILREIGAELIKAFGIKGILGEGITNLQNLKDKIVPAVVEWLLKASKTAVELARNFNQWLGPTIDDLKLIWDGLKPILGLLWEILKAVGQLVNMVGGLFSNARIGITKGYTALAQFGADITGSDFLAAAADSGRRQVQEFQQQIAQRQRGTASVDDVLAKMERHLAKALEQQRKTADATEETAQQLEDGIDLEAIKQATFAY